VKYLLVVSFWSHGLGVPTSPPPDFVRQYRECDDALRKLTAACRMDRRGLEALTLSKYTQAAAARPFLDH
jgi:hypothetical protein